MGLETGTYIDSLVATNPVGSTDAVSTLDGHIQLLKSTIKATFPNVTGAVTATQAELNILDGVTSTAAELNALDGITATVTELNYTDGVTSAIQTQLDAKAPSASPTFTGTVTMTGATAVNVPAPSTGSNATTKTYVDAAVAAGAVAGTWVFIKEETASASASVEFKNGVSSVVFDSTYDEYLFVLHKVLPSADDDKLWMRYSTDGGSTYRTTSYYLWGSDYGRASVASADNLSADDEFVISCADVSTHGVGNATTDEVGLTGEYIVYKPSAAGRLVVSGRCGFIPAAGITVPIEGHFYGQSTASEDADAIQFLFSTGNITSGTFRLYGRLK